MSKKDSGGPVYQDNCYYNSASKTIAYSSGIGRRDWLAAMAMQGLLGNGSVVAKLNLSPESMDIGILVEASLTMADAIIAESRKGEK